MAENVSISLGHGDGTFGGKSDYDAGGTPTSLAIGDLNGDGHPDLVAADFDSYNVAVLLGTGTGAFGPTNYYGTGTGPWSVAIADLNGDGYVDLVVAVDFGILILLGNGDGSFGPHAEYGTGSLALSAAIGDLNEDGRADLAVSNRLSNTVSVLLNVCDTCGTDAHVPPEEPHGGALWLGAPHPNPARGALSIWFTLPHAAPATLRVGDATGRLIATLADGVFEAGRHAARWDGRASAGWQVPQGIYFYELRADGQQLRRKLVVIR